MDSHEGKTAELDYDHSMLNVIYSVIFGFDRMNSVAVPVSRDFLHHLQKAACSFHAWVALLDSRMRARQYPGLLVTFALNARGADAVCVSGCERVSWIMSCCKFVLHVSTEIESRADPPIIGRARRISTADCSCEEKKKLDARTRLYKNDSQISVAI